MPLFQGVSLVQAAGILEVQLLSFSNDDFRDSNGLCCNSPTKGSCSDSCTPYFRICLKQWQNPLLPDAPCYFGSRLTQTFSTPNISSVAKKGMQMNFTKLEDYWNSMKFPFSFNWPVRIFYDFPSLAHPISPSRALHWHPAVRIWWSSMKFSHDYLGAHKSRTRFVLGE